MTQSIPRSFQQVHESATGAQINGMMVRAYLQDKHSIPAMTPAEPYEGAISIGSPGIYSNVFKVDVASLYPSLLLQIGRNPRTDSLGVFIPMLRRLREYRLKYKQLATIESKIE